MKLNRFVDCEVCDQRMRNTKGERERILGFFREGERERERVWVMTVPAGLTLEDDGTKHILTDWPLDDDD